MYALRYQMSRPAHTQPFTSIFTMSRIVRWLVFVFIRLLSARPCIYRRPCPGDRNVTSHQPSTIPQPNSKPYPKLYRGWVKHDSNRCAEGLWWEVASELCSYYTGVSWDEISVSRIQLTFSQNLPCGLVTLPQMTLIFDPLTSFCAR